MSYDYIDPREMKPFWVSHKPRFFGAGLLENFLYAIVNLIESIWILLTFWRNKGTNLTMNVSGWLQAKLYVWRTIEEIAELERRLGDSPKRDG